MFSLLSLILVMNFPLKAVAVLGSPPMLIWGAETPKLISIFQTFTQPDFTNLITKLRVDHMIVVYFASELSAKEINCPICFPFLTTVRALNYYPQVEEPLTALNKCAQGEDDIIWHTPNATDFVELDLQKELPCEMNKIHCFNFTDRHLLSHDEAMEKATDHLFNCSVVHIYTAFAEETSAFGRRHDKEKIKIPNPSMQTFVIKDDYGHPANLTIVRHKCCALGFNRISFAKREQNKFEYQPVNLACGCGLDVGLYNGEDVTAGIVVSVKVDLGSMLIELLPSMGNWYLTRILFQGNSTYYPRDLIYFSEDFSLCGEVLNFYSESGSRLSIFGCQIDVVTNKDLSAEDPKYEGKPCWSCSHMMSPPLCQAIFIMSFFLLMLGVGLFLLTGIGRNSFVQNLNEPPLHVKADN
ncbi:hypothetical protein KR009_012234 [Drosophila setifemur]|nr:hypothetical protein KR009_012234 [Drosophila setifemur]